MSNNPKYKGITIRIETINRLDVIRHQGQSYDGLINEMLDQISKVPPPISDTQNKA